MQRYKITIAYDGAPYSGFQRQINGVTVQGLIEEALTPLNPSFVPIVAASRTDAGVHALGQVAHFDLEISRNSEIVQKALNARLPRDIRIIKTELASPNFHARFDAKKKLYTYTISTAPFQSPFERFHALHFPYPLNLHAIDESIKKLKGTHDFTPFANTNPKPYPTNPVRTLFDISYTISPTTGGDTLVFTFFGDGFLYNMIRNLIGILLDAGQKRISPDEIEAYLHKKTTKRSFTTMPAHALCLKEVFYE